MQEVSCIANKNIVSAMFKSPKGLASRSTEETSATLFPATHRDRSIIFKQVLLDASIKNKFGFQEQDILPLFVKYHSKRQFIIDLLSFSTYVLQLPTKFYLRRLQKNQVVLDRGKNSFTILKTWNNKFNIRPKYKSQAEKFDF